MMQSFFKKTINRILGRKYPTDGFFDENGRYIFEVEIIKLLKQNGVLEDVIAVYIIGSVLNLRNKKFVHLLPSDIDIFVQTTTPFAYIRPHKIEINGRQYPVHWVTYNCHPLEVYPRYNELKLCFECLQIYPRN